MRQQCRLMNPKRTSTSAAVLVFSKARKRKALAKNVALQPGIVARAIQGVTSQPILIPLIVLLVRERIPIPRAMVVSISKTETANL